MFWTKRTLRRRSQTRTEWLWCWAHAMSWHRPLSCLKARAISLRPWSRPILSAYRSAYRVCHQTFVSPSDLTLFVKAFLFWDRNKVPEKFLDLHSDHERMLEVVKASDREWVVVCPPHIEGLSHLIVLRILMLTLNGQKSQLAVTTPSNWTVRWVGVYLSTTWLTFWSTHWPVTTKSVIWLAWDTPLESPIHYRIIKFNYIQLYSIIFDFLDTCIIIIYFYFRSIFILHLFINYVISILFISY